MVRRRRILVRQVFRGARARAGDVCIEEIGPEPAETFAPRRQSLRWSPPAKIVLITHSLGARITLNAFRDLFSQSNKGWVDCLLMVQPAVTLENVTRGSCTWTYIQKWPTPTPTPAAYGGGPSYYSYDPDAYGQVHGPKPISGPYFDSLKFATEAFATMSDHDQVLTEAFGRYIQPDSDTVGVRKYSPNVKEALGALGRREFETSLKSLQYPPNFAVLDFASGSAFPAIHNHGQAFRTTGKLW